MEGINDVDKTLVLVPSGANGRMLASTGNACHDFLRNGIARHVTYRWNRRRLGVSDVGLSVVLW